VTATYTRPRGRPYAGIHCAKCGSIDSHVIDSRNHEILEARRRRHQCNRCGHRYTTYEVAAGEYEKMLATKVDGAEFEAVIAALRAIKVRFGGDGGEKG
jgi:transcriptional regulator NrdR family protein